MFSSTTSDLSSVEINDADCLPRGYRTNYTRSNRTIFVTGEGDFRNCSKHLMTLLNLNATCVKKPCSFNGVYQPEINYNAYDFYGFSEFWYTMQGKENFNDLFVRLIIGFVIRHFENWWTLCGINFS